MAFQCNRAAAGGNLAREHIDQRGLARAIGADDGMDFALMQIDIYIVDGDEPTKAARQSAHGHLGSGAGLSHGLLLLC